MAHLGNAVEETHRRRVRVEYASSVALFRQYYVDNFERLRSALNWADALIEQRRRKAAMQRSSNGSSDRSAICSGVNGKRCEARCAGTAVVGKHCVWSLQNSLIAVMRWLWRAVFGGLRLLEEPTQTNDAFARK